jgi:hypothetical protein
MSRESRAAVARSVRTDRSTIAVIGVLAAAGGAAVLVVGAGWLGRARATRPLADPIALEALRDHRLPAQLAALLAATLLVVFGLWWLIRTVRPLAHPDLVLEDTGDGLVVTANAIAEAIRADAESVSGVAEARARVVRVAHTPALRLRLRLRHGADVRAVWSDLDKRVLARARESLGVTAIPTAIRLELGSAQRQRVR